MENTLSEVMTLLFIKPLSFCAEECLINVRKNRVRCLQLSFLPFLIKNKSLTLDATSKGEEKQTTGYINS